MKRERVVSTHIIVNSRLTTAGLTRAEQAGFNAVEIFCARQHFDYHDQSQINELGYWFRDSALKLHAVHAPIFTDNVWGRSGPQARVTITETQKARRIAWVDEIKRSLDVADVIPFRYLIQHIGLSHEEYDEAKVEAAMSALEELSVYARQRGVEILLENIPNEFSTPERLLQFLDITHLNLNFVFDTGHANLAGNVEQAYLLMRERIRSTHVHDNDGTNDKHLLPMVNGSGTIDWARVMPLLGSRPEQYPIVLEVKDYPGLEQPFDRARESFEELESLAQ